MSHGVGARRARADLAAEHDEVDGGLAREPPRDRAVDGRERDDDLGARLAQPVGLASRRGHGLVGLRAGRRGDDRIDDAEDADAHLAHGLEERGRRREAAPGRQVHGEPRGLHGGRARRENGVGEADGAQAELPQLASRGTARAGRSRRARAARRRPRGYESPPPSTRRTSPSLRAARTTEA